ncbi:AAA domain-containing protein [Nocardia sp. NPDC019395]|uniref:AAA domain-containing protein n=1 Tax=Nocardia sp. NPDC019395 TaxID=3154686 RepID=UPI0033E11E92
MKNHSGKGGDPADRGARLFEFLARAQSIGARRVTNLEAYRRDGTVIWLGEVPEHPAVVYRPEVEAGPFLSVGKVVVTPPPEPNENVRPWLFSSTFDDCAVPPEIRELRTVFDDDGEESELCLSGDPELTEQVDAWLAEWRLWSASARQDVEALRLYRDVYDMYTQLGAASETLEAVVGLGLLDWHRQGGEIRRHLLTMGVMVEFDTRTGAVTVSRERGIYCLAVELADILDISELGAAQDLRAAEELARGGIDPFDRDDVGELVRMLINCVHPQALYTEDPEITPRGTFPVASFSPALILRRRGKRGLVKALEGIATRIRDTGDLPAGIHNLVDPGAERDTTPDLSEGAIVRHGRDSFLPLPLNEVQLRILDNVDANAHTIVQGPPGTGKTHTAAALITHLLAQGKRVLVTAHTDRALVEVRDKIPAEIRPLCVSVVGTSRDDFADLQVAVNGISQAADDHDPDHAGTEIAAAQRRVTMLCARRTAVLDKLVRLREQEVLVHEVRGYSGTLTELVLRHREQLPVHGWIAGLARPDIADSLLISGAEAAEWRDLLLDEALRDPEAAHTDDLTAADLPRPADFGRWCEIEAAAAARARSFDSFRHTELKKQFQRLSGEQRVIVRSALHQVQTVASGLANRHEQWIIDAVRDIRSGRGAEWHTRAAKIADLITEIAEIERNLGHTEVTTTSADLGILATIASNLQEHIAAKGPIKVGVDGAPKNGFMTPKVIKDAAPLFENVKVDRRIPTTPEHLEKIIHFERATRLLDLLDKQWPESTEVSREDTVGERLEWHRTEHQQLRRVLDFAAQLAQVADTLQSLGLPAPDWAAEHELQRFLKTIESLAAEESWRDASAPIHGLESRVGDECDRNPDAVSPMALRTAVRRRDAAGYSKAYHRLVHLHELRHRLRRRRQLAEQMAEFPGLRDAILEQLEDPHWPQRLEQLAQAWDWAILDRWLADSSGEYLNELCRELDAIEDALRGEATLLARTRAWNRAVASDRLTASRKTYLRQYAQLSKRLGKGTGKYADDQRAGIRKALERCRSAVPVWIMPIYRVVEQFDIEQDMFDVVVVDEASQAGLESVFLQYLAPRIVVIGDDKQVSPAGVGIDQSEMRGLAEQYLGDDELKDSWVDTKRSLFDEAVMRFQSRLTLIEHRRCVPEIIGFSNKIAYEPDNVRLVPVRLLGSDRLPPIRTVLVTDGRSTESNINDAEAELIVARIEECLADPRYDNMTFGVISLLGTRQAKHIWQKLVRRIEPDELNRRQLRCGDAADFQGAERNVVFLSMVKSGDRLTAQTRDDTLQRYNVAVSRARDQVWLFHSVTLDQLTNPEDLRFRLLEYCLEAQRGSAVAEAAPEPVPEDVLVAPFESLFEQRVFNRIVARGYRVEPHFDATGYDIDLVVIGRKTMVAIQCDGDQWQGTEEFHRDLARQRDLERCDWPFHRIRQSAFTADPERCLQPLWQLLEDVGLEADGELPAPEAGPLTASAAELSGPAPADVVIDADPESISATLAQMEAEFAGTIADEPYPEPVLPDPVVPAVTADAGESLGPNDVSAAVAVDIAVVETSDIDDSALRPAVTVGTGTALVTSPLPPRDQRTVAPYEVFRAVLSSPSTAPDRTILESLVAIVATEGPVTESRLRSVYTRSAHTRQTPRIRAKLDKALDAAVRSGTLRVDNPLDLPDPTYRTYRTPDQPLSRWRLLGPRGIDQVPVQELAEIMANCSREHGWDDPERLMRATLEALDQSLLTDKAVAALALVLPWAKLIADDDT